MERYEYHVETPVRLSGYFSNKENGCWEEFQNNSLAFTFDETGRDTEWIYLLDKSRNPAIFVALPLKDKTAFWGKDTGGDMEWHELYDVNRILQAVPPVHTQSPINFIHLSDLHIAVDHRANADVIARLSNIQSRYPNHYLIITGDIIDNEGDVPLGTTIPLPFSTNLINRGVLSRLPNVISNSLKYTKRALQNAHNILKHFKDKVFLCPGNHDFGLYGNLYSREYADAYDNILAIPLGCPPFAGDNHPAMFRVTNGGLTVKIYSLDTNLETTSFRDFACGEVGATQLRELEKMLAIPYEENESRIVMIHHHPWFRKPIQIPGTSFRTEAHALLDAGKFLDLLKRYPIDYLCFGHEHKEEPLKRIAGARYGALAAGCSRSAHRAYELVFPVTGGRLRHLVIN